MSSRAMPLRGTRHARAEPRNNLQSGSAGRAVQHLVDAFPQHIDGEAHIRIQAWEGSGNLSRRSAGSRTT